MSTLVSNIIKPRSGDTVTFSNSNISATDGTFSGNVSISGTVTYEDVTSVDSVGIVTAGKGVRVTDGGLVVTAGGLVVNAGVSTLGVVTGATYYGDGSNLEGVVSGIELEQAGSSVGTSLTAINFASGATITAASGGISTITIAAGIETSASYGQSGIITLDLSNSQHHDIYMSAGISTITCSGGSVGDSHSVILTNTASGVTVGFSTYFLWPSGSSPVLGSSDGNINLLSFVVKRVGAGGTQLLSSAGLNYQ